MGPIDMSLYQTYIKDIVKCFVSKDGSLCMFVCGPLYQIQFTVQKNLKSVHL